MNNLEKLQIENYRPLREIVFQYLRESILDGKLEPGKRLMEMQLAEELGVSRTPIREAIRKLELEGLVIMEPRKGAYVADISVKDMMDVLEIRAALEGLAASLATERMTDEDIEDLKILADEFKQFHIERNIQGMIEKDIEFHDKIFVTTKNEKLYQISQSLREQIYRFRVRYISEYDQSKNLIMEHDKILKAIINRDRKMAYNYGWEHIDNLRKHVKNSVKSKTE
ncbi:MAG: GntR family transcriptional regulator [Clostridiales bacterium]|nr:GntR family transcriptional regulator [Clostridiales bacterium]